MKKTYQNAKRLTLLFLSFMLLSFVHGQIVITGTVMDGEFGGGLPGANVVVKGTTTGTSTDIDGKYSIKVPDENAVLQFSSIGFASQSIKVGEKRVIDLTLKKDVKQIEEVVKVGYGVQKKTDVTGSVSQIGGDDIASRPVVGVDQAIQGKISGVQVTSNSGSPGSEAMVRIRGTGSINNSDPLYVVDGIPQGGAPNINPTEIKSISVLKDASACAIYGSRAANGVVLITTKDGKMAKKAKSSDCENNTTSEISVDGYYGIQTVEKYLDLMNAKDYYKAYKVANALPPGLSSIKYMDTTGEGTNWQKEIFRNAPTQRYTIAFETGSEISSFRTSCSFLKQDGIVKGSDYQSISVGGKGNHNLKKWLTVQETFGYSNSLKHQIPEGSGIYSGNPILSAIVMDPTVPVKADTTVATFDRWNTNYYNAVFNQVSNPARLIDLNNQQNRNNGFSGSFAADIKLMRDLVFRSQLGINGYTNTYTGYNKTYFQNSTGFSRDRDANLNLSYDYGWGYTFTNTATYSKDFMDRNDSMSVAHSLSILVGNEVYYSKSDGYSLEGHYMNEALAEENVHISEADTIKVNKNKVPSELAMTSLLGRINYAFKNKYLLTSNIRYDWVSRFVKGNRLGIFPSFSAGWKISDENFFKNNEKLKNLNECKVRFGWGQIGNQNIKNDERYPFASRMTTTYKGYSFNGKSVSGYTIDNTANKDLKWETTEMINIGIDVSVLQNKVTLSVDAFRKITKGMLVDIDLPMISGAERDYIDSPDPTVTVNGGSILNRGAEATISYKGKIAMKHTLDYEIGGNIAYIKNEVKSIGDTAFIKDDFIKSKELADMKFMPCRTEVGFGIADFYGLNVTGIYQNWEEINNGPKMENHIFKPGDYKYEDINGDGIINVNDYVHLGSPLPKLTYGFYLNGNFSFVDFNFTFQGSYGNKIFNALKYYTQSGQVGWNSTNNRTNAWTETNLSTEETRLSDVPKANWENPSSAYIESGSYLRLKDVVIGFTLPEAFAKKLKVNKLRVYGQIQNALTWTKYSGYDPEIGQLTGESTKSNTTIGVDQGSYPHARTFLCGFNFSF